MHLRIKTITTSLEIQENPYIINEKEENVDHPFKLAINILSDHPSILMIKNEI